MIEINGLIVGILLCDPLKVKTNVQRKRRGLILADTESKFLASSQRPYNTHSYATHKNRFDVQTDVTGT